MSDVVISVEKVSKRYLVGHQSSRRSRYTALRDVLGREARNFVRKAGDFLRGRQIVQGDEVEEFWALTDVSFDIKAGEVLGIIGRNGAGKSTLLKILSRITEPTKGRAILRGRVASLLEVGTGFHPELSGRENIYLNGAILGMTRAEIARKFNEIVEFAEVEQFLDTPVKHYSSGMHVRLAFAVAAHLEPEILLIDEVLAVGDIEFQQKCIGKMRDVSTAGRTVLFVSHNMSAIRSLTSRCVVLSQGQLVFDGEPNVAVDRYSIVADHAPVTNRLLGEGEHTAVRSIRLVDDRGNPTNNYLPGKPLRLQLTLFTDGTPSLSAEVILVGADRQKLGMVSLHHFHGTTLPRAPGVYETLVEIEPLWLASGAYSLDVATSVVNSHWDHYVEDAVQFNALSSNRANQPWDFKQSYGQGAFALACVRAPEFARVREEVRAVTGIL